MKYFRMYGKNFEAYIPVDNILSFGLMKNKMWLIIEDKSFETNVRPKEQLKALLTELNALDSHHIVGITKETQ